MKRTTKKPTRDRMIHIRLDEQTHRELKLLAVQTDATVQSVVEDLIRRKVAEAANTSRGARRAKGKA